MKIDLSKNKRNNNGDDQNKKQDKEKDASKSPSLEMLENRFPFITVLTDRFSPRTLLIALVIFLFIFVALVGRMFGGGEEELPEENSTGTPQEEVVAEDPEESEEPKEESKEEPKEEPVEEEIVEIQMEDVKANLINPDKSIDDTKKVKNVVSKGIKHLEELAEKGETYKPKDNKALGSTDIPIANDIILAMQAGYKANVKKSEWTQGSKDFVYQFVIPMFKEDEPNAFLSGNYNTKNDDFQIVRAEGIDYSAIASPGTGEEGEDFQQGPSEEDIKKIEEEKAKKKNKK